MGAERLVRVLCENCKEPYKPDKRYLESLGFEAVDQLFKSKGCAQCANTGFKGRKAIYEVYLVNDILRSAIQQNSHMPV